MQPPTSGLCLCERTNKFCPIETLVVLGFAVKTIKHARNKWGWRGWALVTRCSGVAGTTNGTGNTQGGTGCNDQAGLAEWLVAGWELGALGQRGVRNSVLRASGQQVGGL